MNSSFFGGVNSNPEVLYSAEKNLPRTNQTSGYREQIGFTNSGMQPIVDTMVSTARDSGQV